MIITLDIPSNVWDILSPSLSKYSTSESRATISNNDAHRKHISEVRRLAGLKGVRAKRIKRGLPVPDEQLIPLTFDDPTPEPEPQSEPIATAAPVSETLVSEPAPEPAATPLEPELFPVEEVIIPTTECPSVSPMGDSQPPKDPPIDYQSFVNVWNDICGQFFPKIRLLTKQRKDKLKTRCNEIRHNGQDPLEVFTQVCNLAIQSPFMKSGHWFAFDWIIANDNNYLKVLEGKYSHGTELQLRNNGTYRPSDLRSQQLQRDWELAQHQAAMLNGSGNSGTSTDIPI